MSIIQLNYTTTCDLHGTKKSSLGSELRGLQERVCGVCRSVYTRVRLCRMLKQRTRRTKNKSAFSYFTGPARESNRQTETGPTAGDGPAWSKYIRDLVRDGPILCYYVSARFRSGEQEPVRCLNCSFLTRWKHGNNRRFVLRTSNPTQFRPADFKVMPLHPKQRTEKRYILYKPKTTHVIDRVQGTRSHKRFYKK